MVVSSFNLIFFQMRNKMRLPWLWRFFVASVGKNWFGLSHFVWTLIHLDVRYSRRHEQFQSDAWPPRSCNLTPLHYFFWRYKSLTIDDAFKWTIKFRINFICPVSLIGIPYRFYKNNFLLNLLTLWSDYVPLFSDIFAFVFQIVSFFDTLITIHRFCEENVRGVL